MHFKNLQSGFNLVELMVVVSIIGILSSVAVPRFQTFKARATQTEAKSGLNGLYLSMQAYQANYNAFPVLAAQAPTAANVGFTITGNQPKYGYLVVSNAVAWAGAANSFTPGGQVVGPLANNSVDAWRINANKILCARYDAISNVAVTAAPGAFQLTALNSCSEGGASLAAAFSPAIVAADNVVN